MTPDQLRDLRQWVDQYAAGLDEMDARAVAAVLAVYAGVNFYSPTAVAAAAEEAAEASNLSAAIMAGLAAQYIATVTSMIGDEQYPTPAVLLPLLRNGADMRRVFERPVKLFRRQVSKGVPPAEAMRQAMELASVIVGTNNRLAAREAWAQALERLGPDAGITGYRRIVHPELARTGTCGLCLVASDNVYKRAALMPLHARCNCTVMPIIGARGGAGDPGNSLNRMSTQGVIDAAGSSHGFDLKKIRVAVNDHGEYGPTLGYAGQRFTDFESLRSAA